MATAAQEHQQWPMGSRAGSSKLATAASEVSCPSRGLCACSLFGNTGQRNKKRNGYRRWPRAKLLDVSVSPSLTTAQILHRWQHELNETVTNGFSTVRKGGSPMQALHISPSSGPTPMKGSAGFSYRQTQRDSKPGKSRTNFRSELQ